MLLSLLTILVSEWISSSIDCNFWQPNNFCDAATGIDRRSQNLRHLYPGMGLKFGVFGFFPHNQNNHDSSGAYVQRSECKDKYAWNIAWRTMLVDIFCLRLLPCVWSANTPTWRSMADDTITWDGIGVLGSPFYICGYSTSKGDFVAVFLKLWMEINRQEIYFLILGWYFMRRNEMKWLCQHLKNTRRGGGMKMKSQTHAPIPLPKLFCITSDFNQGQSH